MEVLSSLDDARNCLSWWCVTRVDKSCSKLYRFIKLLCQKIIEVSEGLGNITDSPDFSIMGLHLHVESLKDYLHDWHVPNHASLWNVHNELTKALNQQEEDTKNSVREYFDRVRFDTVKRLGECLHALDSTYSCQTMKAAAVRATADIDDVDPDLCYVYGVPDERSDDAKIIILLAFMVHILKRDHPDMSSAAKDALEEQIQGHRSESMWTGSDDSAAIQAFILALAPLAVRNVPKSKRSYQDHKWGNLTQNLCRELL